MSENVLTIKKMLHIIFITTKKNPHILADKYLHEDVSLISEWREDRTFPKDKDISKIIDFATNESSELQRKIIREEIEDLIIISSLKAEIKINILNTGTFEGFLTKVFNIAVLFALNNTKRGKIKTCICEAKEENEAVYA